MLQQAGYQVMVASTGKDALETIIRERPALVLLDVNLPDMSGYEVCRRIKASPELSGIPVLHMSASFVKADDQVRGLQGGADGYITEPIDPDVLLATIKAALRVRESEQARAKAQHAAEDAQARLKVLADVGFMLSETKTPETSLESIAAFLVPKFSDAAAIILFDESGRPYAMSSAHIDADRASLLRQILSKYPPDLRHSSGRNAQAETQLIAPMTDQFLMNHARDGEHFMMMKGVGATSCIVANIAAHERKLGVIVLATATPGRSFSQQDLNFVSELTRRMAIVIDNVRLLRQAQQHNRMKDEFLASLAHELRNPLAPIRYATQLMASKLQNPEEIDKLRKLIARQVHHISRMVDDLTDVARIEHGKLNLRRESVDLVAVVREAVQNCSDLIQQKHQNLNLELPEQPVFINGDSTRLEQIVCNLIHNAAKYTPELGTVNVGMESRNDGVIVKIKDNGIGISSRLLPRIFELFTQAPQSLDRPQGGLGIGLTIVRHLVNLHGGSISARSDGEGKGSEFTLQFPVVDVPVAVEQKTAASGSGVRSRRVLVVEDNSDIRETMTMLLTIWGHEIKHASDGNSALKVMKDWKPDVVLLDIGLPGTNGYRVAEQIRSVPEWKDIYLVAATGYSSPRDKKMAEEAGFNTMLVKPVDLEKLKELLRRHEATTR